MKFVLTFDCDNSAFDANVVDECARTLCTVINKLDAGTSEGSIMDLNGNVIGYYKLEE